MIRLLVTVEGEDDPADADEYAGWIVSAFQDVVPCQVQHAPPEGPVFGPLRVAAETRDD